MSPFRLNGTSAVYDAGSLGVGTAAPDASALVDLSSATQGFLPPRMSRSQREAIPSPAKGLMVFDTTMGEVQVHDGQAWSAAGARTGMGWIRPVLDLGASAPAHPAAGDRYIATAAWAGQGNAPGQVATWNGTGWTFETPAADCAVFALARNNAFVFHAGVWSAFAPTLAQMGASTRDVLAWNGSAWAPAPGGTVTSVTAAAPLTGGTITGSGTVGIAQASATRDGYLSAADWAAFNAKGSGTVVSVGASAPLSSTGGSAPTIAFTGVLGASNGGTGIGAYAKGDLLYATPTGALGRLPAGRTGDILTMDNGLPTWSQPVVKSVPRVYTVERNDKYLIVTANDSAPTILLPIASNHAGQVLTVYCNSSAIVVFIYAQEADLKDLSTLPGGSPVQELIINKGSGMWTPITLLCDGTYWYYVRN